MTLHIQGVDVLDPVPLDEPVAAAAIALWTHSQFHEIWPGEPCPVRQSRCAFCKLPVIAWGRVKIVDHSPGCPVGDLRGTGA